MAHLLYTERDREVVNEQFLQERKFEKQLATLAHFNFSHASACAHHRRASESEAQNKRSWLRN